MSYDICLFDLDGTLTDPKLGIAKGFKYALSAFGIHEEPECVERFIGPPLRESFRDFYGFSDDDIEKAIAAFREYYGETGLFENEVYPDIAETLQSLKEHGKTLAVATSKIAIFANRVLEHFSLADYFAFVSGDEVDGSLTKNGKQDVVRIALDALDPERKMSTVMIGDRNHDIIAAQANGIDSIGIMWGYGSRDEFEAAGATWIVDTVSKLFNSLK